MLTNHLTKITDLEAHLKDHENYKQETDSNQ